MSSWRIQKRYGFGAGRVMLSPSPHRTPATPDGLWQGFRRAADELRWEIDEERSFFYRKNAAGAATLLLAFLVFWVVGQRIVHAPPDESDIELHLFSEVPPPVEPLLEEPLPEPQLVQQPVVELEPEPMVVTPPSPKPVVKPAPPVERVAVREPPKPVAPPKPRVAVQIDRVKPRPTPQPAPSSRRTRIEAPEPELARRRMTVPAPSAVSETPSPPPPRSQPQRVAVATPRSDTRPRVAPNLAPAALAPESAAADAPRARRQSVSFAPAQDHSAGPRPSLAPTPVAPADVPSTPQSRRASRVQAPSAPSSDSRRSSPDLAPTAVAASPAPRADASPAPRRQRAVAPAPQAAPSRGARPELAAPGVRTDSPQQVASAKRTSRVQHTVTAAPSRSTDESELQGVPLGSLAACMTDREEDSLKQQLLAAVTTQEKCVSSAGTYRFIETKNLNAFLMRIQRAPGRAVGDRCDELRLALRCIRGGG